MRATAVSFDVSDVSAATELLGEVPTRDAVEALLTVGLSRSERNFIELFTQRGQSFPMPEAPPRRPVESCFRYHGRLVAEVAYHPVVAAVHLAFQDHRPLVLSPDIVWLMIVQGVANHINANAEALRSKFVRHEGRAEIVVRRDDFIKGSPENPWPEVFRAFSKTIGEHVGPAVDLFRPGFSTTGPVETAAAEVVLLDAMQSYFTYVATSRCGIPSITLEGTRKDWEAVADRAKAFSNLGLDRWLSFLSPILGQFVRASRGSVDTAFWNSIYKRHAESGGDVITGWITAFFPYWKDWETKRPTGPSRGFSGAARRRRGP